MTIEEFYKDKLIKAASYSGNREPGEKVISSSSIGDDDLVWYLKYKHGTTESNEFGQNVIGSMYQLGIDQAFAECGNVESALRLHHEIPGTDFYLTGEIDQLVHIEQDGVVHHYIIDNKLVKYKTKDAVMKDGLHPYVLQLNAYRWLLHRTGHIDDYEPVHIMLALTYKDGTIFAKEEIPSFELVDLELMLMDDNTFESIIKEKANRLNSFLEFNQAPSECKQKFWNMSAKKRTGKAVPERCARNWCGVADHCPYYKKKPSNIGLGGVKSLLGRL